MAITVKHTKVSLIPDGDDTSVVRPSDWNADHQLVGTIPVENGGTGASTLTGYVKGNGTAAMTASATVPSTDITGLGTMSTQNSNNINVTGGSISGTTVAGYVPTTTTITAGTGLSGGGDLSANRTLAIANTTVTAAAYGSASKTLTATVNAQGQLTALADTNIAITNTQVSGLGTASTKDAGAALGVATLDSGGKVPVSELPAAVLGALSYQGTWDASTNTPTLTSSVGTKGYYYVVSVAGSTNLNGITDWLVGDWAVYNGTAWQKVDNTDAVTSVNGFTGAVVLTTTNVAEGTNEYFTQTKARNSVSAGTGISYVSSTGVITNAAPDQTVVLNAGTGISTSGTYPNFTITNTSPSAGGDVVGPASATDNAIARFDTTTGKLIQNSVVTVSDTGAIAGATTITNLNYLDFDTTYATTLGAGQLGWNGNDTLGLGMIGGNVVQHIGEDVFFYVKASATITKGQLCMFTGAVGSSGVLTAAPSTAIPFAEAIIGVAAENIANNGFGLIQSVGTLRGVDTSAFLDGDVLYYNSAVTGGFTKTYPASGPVVIAAAVAKSGSGGSGVLTVRISFQTRVTGSTGISVVQGNDTVALTNTGVTSAVAGTGISVSGATGAVTVTNTAPDQTVVLTAGTGISTSGTYPNFTVTNTAPDQVVALTGAGTTSISGTYPNFTITSNDSTVGTVTSVSGTGTVNGISLSGTVTSSGNLTLGGTLSNVSLSTQVTGTLPIANGGTGETTRQAAIDALAGAVTSGQYLRGNGTDVVMSAIQAADVPTLNQNTTGTASNVTGTVAIANGGTGQTTATAAFNALNPMTTTGDIIYEASATTAARLGIGSTGQVLTVAGGIPSWATPASGSSNITALGLWENSATISANYTIGTGNNAQSAGPITINTGVTVTVPSGSTWVVV